MKRTKRPPATSTESREPPEEIRAKVRAWLGGLLRDGEQGSVGDGDTSVFDAMLARLDEEESHGEGA